MGDGRARRSDTTATVFCSSDQATTAMSVSFGTGSDWHRKGYSKTGGYHRMKYAVVFEKGPNSVGATVPDLPGCFAIGRNVEVAAGGRVVCPPIGDTQLAAGTAKLG